MRAAFSLVELSIVLVILGLLTGGILAGQSLIRASELRSVGTDYDRYVTAQNAFRDKYFALPGDIANATSFWGDDNDACPDNAIPNGTPGTCNGDGNGQFSVISAPRHEYFRYWQHLALAGLIEGRFTGVAGSGGSSHAAPGENTPQLKLSRAGFHATSLGTLNGVANYYDGYYGIFYRLGGNDGSGLLNTRILRPSELWNIDTKLDDGRPGNGRVRSFDTAADPNCSTDAANYNLSTTTIACRAIFLTGR